MKLPEFLTEWPFGEIVLTGHRVSLYHIISRHREGFSVERLHEEYPSVSPEHIRKVLAFYEANRAEVDAYVDRYRADLEEQYATWKREFKGPTVEELKQRLRARGKLGPNDEWL